MAKLTTAARKRLPGSAFGEPAARKYPMPDAAHAANAKARASQAVNAGRMSAAQERKIDAKADRKLGHAPDGRGNANKDRAADRVIARISKPKPAK